MTSAQTFVYSGGDVAAVSGSTLRSLVAAGATSSVLVVAAEGGTYVSDATLEGEGSVSLLGSPNSLYAGGAIFTVGAPVTVTNSHIVAVEPDPTDGDDAGTVTIAGQLAPLAISDGAEIRADRDVNVLTALDDHGVADVSIEDSVIHAGVFAADVDDPSAALPGSITVATASSAASDIGPTVSVVDSSLASSNSLSVSSSINASQRFSLSGSSFSAGDGNDLGTVSIMQLMPRATSVRDNTFTADSAVEIQLGVSGPSLNDAVVTDNDIAVVGDVSPRFSAIVGGGSCTLERNVVNVTDVSGDGPAVTQLACSSTLPGGVFTLKGNTVTDSGDGSSGAEVGLTGGAVDFAKNAIQSEGGVAFDLSGSTGELGDNDLLAGSGSLVLKGTADTVVRFTGNEVGFDAVAAEGLSLIDLGDATVDANTFTNLGTPAAGSTALSVRAALNAVGVRVQGNTFSDFERALVFADEGSTPFGIDATVTDNVFDFAIAAAPEAAELIDVGDAIDATDNVWGSNTSAATVATYVTLSGDTGSLGGSIDVDPLTAP